MKKHLVIILDPAHGEDVKGKRSPDGSHLEYLWSRKVETLLEKELLSLGYKVYWTSQSNNEIGLSKRKQIANDIKIERDETKFLLSLHNNAAGNGIKWMTASGVEIWTSKGKTLSDLFSEKLFEGLHTQFPENSIIKYRYGGNLGDRDKDENFTVLMGNYYACLVEWLFQDNIDDVKMLKDDNINLKLVKALVEGINYINDYVTSKLER